MIRRLLISLALLVTLYVGAFAARGNHQVATTGYINPAAASFNGGFPMVACASGCSTGLINQNTDALQAALDQASSGTHPTIYLPPNDYPIARGGAAHNQIYGVRLLTKSRVVLVGYGATLRMSGDLGAGANQMFEIDGGSSNVRIYGLTFSQRDLSHSPIPEQSHQLVLGTGIHSATDNVQIVDCTFTDGKGGDAIRVLGGSSQAEAVMRLAIHHNTINGKRSGIAYQHGGSMHNVVDNSFGPDGTDQLIDHEPTSFGGNHYENIIGNYFLRPSGTAPLNTVGGASSGDTLRDTSFSNVWMNNTMPTGSISGLRIRGTWFINNSITTLKSTGTAPSPVVSLPGASADTWFVDNYFGMKSLVVGATQIVTLEQNSGFLPRSAWYRGNTFDAWHSGTGLFIDSGQDVIVTNNVFVYHDPAINGFAPIGVTVQGGDDAAGRPLLSSVIAAGNRIIRGLQVDGVTPAGIMSEGFTFGPNTSTNTAIGYGIWRDNFIDGATKLAVLAAPGVTFPEGVPTIAGNQLINNTSTTVTGTYLTESTIDAELTTSSGLALSISKHTTIIGANSGGGDVYSIPAGIVDGFVKTVMIYSASTTTGVFTPAAFGDGTSITWSVTASAKASFSIVWDAADATWRLLSKSSGITVNP